MKLTQTNYVDMAEKTVLSLSTDEEGSFLLKSAKLRNLLGMVSDIYNDVAYSMDAELSDEIVERLQYIRMRFAYEAGREKEDRGNGRKRDKKKATPIEELLEKGNIKEILLDIGKDRKKCICFCRYMEAIVAYHKFYNGRDRR